MNDPSILVIKLGALGDFVQALGPLAAIRQHHPDQPITLLTTAPFVDLAHASGLVDHVQIDERPRMVQFGKWRTLRRFLINGGFERVYDLQTSDRSCCYYRLFFPGPKPEWSGIAKGCSHPHANPERDFMHTMDRQREQLKMAGIHDVPEPDVSFADADLEALGLPDRFALLVPGGAPHRPAKRWPASRFQEMAQKLKAKGIIPVVIGVRAESDLAGEILENNKTGLNLTGKTDLITLAALARRAVCAIGNDTGPMHMMAVAGCHSIVLFSDQSDPALCAPRGKKVDIIVSPVLANLSVKQVIREAGLFVS